MAQTPHSLLSTPRWLWVWGTLDALAAALWAGPTAAFLAAFALELGAGGGQLGLLLALNTLLANGLQLQGAQWARRSRTSRRVYLAAILARGTWLLAGTVPAALALAGRKDLALAVFLVALVVSSVATAAANPAMGARAATVVDEPQRTRYIADRMIATWLGVLLGTSAVTALLQLRPGVLGYGAGFAIAGALGLCGLGAYAALLHRAGVSSGARPAARPPVPPPPPPPLHRPHAERLDAGTPSGTSDVSDVSERIDPVGRAPEAQPPLERDPAADRPVTGWWRFVARRLGAPERQALGDLVLAAAILQGGASMIGPASPIWLVKHLGAPGEFLGWVSLASSLAAMASQRVWARWIDRVGAERVIGYAATGAALIPVGWMLVRQPWVAVPLSAYGGISWGGYSLAMTTRLLQMAPPADRPAYLGTYAAAVGAAGAIGSLLAGAITAVVPVPWIPAVFLCSFLVRALGWRSLARRPA